MQARADTRSGRPSRGVCRGIALLLASSLLCWAAGCHLPQTRGQVSEEDERDKDLEVATVGDVTEVANVATIAVHGVGLVVGLEGTGGTPAGSERTMLEADLRKARVKDVSEVLASPNNALVRVSALIPAGSRKGDPIDVTVQLPPGTKATSLRGGYLMDCNLRDYETRKHIDPTFKGSDGLLPGHVLARARGPLLVGFGSNDDDTRLHRGRIFEGGVALIDRPFFLTLKKDRKYARVAGAVADRINAMFQDDPKRQAYVLENKRYLVVDEVTGQINDTFRTPALGNSEMAKALNKDAVYVKVPYEYRLNPERYLRVVRLIPLRETVETRGRYRKRLHEILEDPAKTMRAALRLEALGKESIPALREALRNEHPLVRFSAAEALAYLGSPSGVDELAKLAEQYDALRAYSLMAMACLDESASHIRLAEMMSSSNGELRYGAFRALRILNEGRAPEDQDPETRGELLNESFWLHRVAPKSAPMVHFSVGKRAEIVLFGEGAEMAPPFRIRAGQEFTVTADRGDSACIVSRFMIQQGEIKKRRCGLRVDDVLRAMAELGALYPDAVELLRQGEQEKCISCAVRLNATPALIPVQELAANANNLEFLREAPAAAQHAEGTSGARSRAAGENHVAGVGAP